MTPTSIPPITREERDEILSGLKRKTIPFNLRRAFLSYEAKLRRLEEALRPFAECAALFDGDKFTEEELPNEEILIADGAFAEIEDKHPLTFGDFRRARKVLEE